MKNKWIFFVNLITCRKWMQDLPRVSIRLEELSNLLVSIMKYFFLSYDMVFLMFRFDFDTVIYLIKTLHTKKKKKKSITRPASWIQKGPNKKAPQSL